MAINYKSDVSKLQRDLERLIKKMPKVTGTSTKKALENLKSYCEDSGTTDLKILRRIYRESNAEFTDENGMIALVGDCKKLSTSEVTVLKLEMANICRKCKM